MGFAVNTEHFQPTVGYLGGTLSFLNLQSTDPDCIGKEDSRYWSFEDRRDSEQTPPAGTSTPPRTSISDSTGLFPVLLWVAIIIGALLLLFLLYAAINAFSRRRVVYRGAGGNATQSADAETERIIQSGGALQTAEDLAAQGDYRGALRLLYLSVLHKLYAMGVIDIDENRTNWELLRLLQQKGQRQIHGILLPVTRLFDRAWYGEMAISNSEYRDAFEATKAILGGGESQ
jgi:hypothetical protein